jgi:transcriptional regulator with XRE-family HTH domain
MFSFVVVGVFWCQESLMSAGFDACNLNPVPLEFVSGPQKTQSTEPQLANTQLIQTPAVKTSLAETQLAKKQLTVAEPQTRCEDDLSGGASAVKQSTVSVPRNLQRVAEAREQQGFSLRTISRRTGIDLKTLRTHEVPTTDLKLSELHAWQLALEVPLADLIVDDLQPLSSPVRDRASLVRIMKTVVAIKEAGGSPRIQRLADMLFEQMVSLMPELKEIGAWPQHGGRRSSGSSRIIEQQVNTNSLGSRHDD